MTKLLKMTLGEILAAKPAIDKFSARNDIPIGPAYRFAEAFVHINEQLELIEEQKKILIEKHSKRRVVVVDDIVAAKEEMIEKTKEDSEVDWTKFLESQVELYIKKETVQEDLNVVWSGFLKETDYCFNFDQIDLAEMVDDSGKPLRIMPQDMYHLRHFFKEQG